MYNEEIMDEYEERPIKKRRRMEQDDDEPEEMYLNLLTIPDYAIPDPDQAELSKLNEIIVPCTFVHGTYDCGWNFYDYLHRMPINDNPYRYVYEDPYPDYLKVWLNEYDSIIFKRTLNEHPDLAAFGTNASNIDVVYMGSFKKSRRSFYRR